MIESPQLTKTDQLDAIAKSIAQDMCYANSSIEIYVPLKLSLMLTVIDFCGIFLFHIMFTFLYHRYKVFRELTRKFIISQRGDLQLKLVFSVSPDKIDVIDKSRNEWKDTFLLQFNQKNFSGVLELDPKTAGPLRLIKVPVPKTAAHSTIHETKV